MLSTRLQTNNLLNRAALGSIRSINAAIQQQRHRYQSTLQPSTIDTGYILSLPPLPNPATSDNAYQRLLSWYLPPDLLQNLQPRLEKFGDEAVSNQINEWVSNAERQQPYVKTRNVWGAKYASDRLVTSHGWKELGRWGIRNG